MKTLSFASVALWGSLLLLAPAIGRAADEGAEEGTVTVGKFKMTVPEEWVRKEPKVRIIDHEFAAKASEDDAADGRITMMFSGGSIEANISRWRNQQFTEIDEATPEDPRELTIAGQKILVVDIIGTYIEMGTGAERPNYRMLAGIISLKDGNYFVKFIGPRRTVTDHEPNFLALLESLELK
jgi:hypothetical protein